MAGDPSAMLHGLLARVAAGDQAARHELIGCAYQRLRCLARVILNESFPRLKAAPAALETTDVADEAALGMYQVLAEIPPATPRDFFRLAHRHATSRAHTTMSHGLPGSDGGSSQGDGEPVSGTQGSAGREPWPDPETAREPRRAIAERSGSPSRTRGWGRSRARCPFDPHERGKR
jgi:hypothetical protein